ncbi:MAG TPA: D-beta-D-heptose 1-phosphate adenosyltransferase, partial [bacterium]|nr:D-beta-D-heptose 1-phosphate adenosyltransferase [bacterium]
AYTKSIMAKSANKRIGVLDHTKIGQEYLVSFCPVSDLDILIVDRETSPEYVDVFRDMGIEVILV